MEVSSIMNREVEYINQDASLQDAAILMRDFDCGCLPVESKDRLVGMITDRDIITRAVAEKRNLKKEKVKNVMTKNIKYCFENDDIVEVGRLMSQNHLRRLPVMSLEKKLVGIVSLGDVARRAGTLNYIASDTLESMAV